MTEIAQNLTLPEGFHEKSKIREVLLSTLKVDRSYQREPSMTLADDIAADWDEVASELILVSDRGPREEDTDSGLFVVNGQHRTLAARKLGHKKIWARVIDMSDIEDPGAIEATLRLKTNVRLGDRALERFKAQVRAGDEQSQAIVKLLERFDTQINQTPTQEEGINAVAGVEALYRLDDGGILAETLEVIHEAYGRIAGPYAAIDLMKGVAWFIIQHSEQGDKARLLQQLQNYGVMQIKQRARTIQATMAGPSWQNHYRALVELYNDKLRVGQRLEPRLRGASSWHTGRARAKWGRG